MSVSTLSSTAMLGDKAFVEAAAHVGPAEGGAHIPLLGEHAIASIAIDLENALEAGKMGYRLGSLGVLAHDDAIGTGVDTDGTRPPSRGPSACCNRSHQQSLRYRGRRNVEAVEGAAISD
jgi:hypothetical protein